MTHSYQFCESLPHTRKKLNAAFVHRIKKLCGRVYRLHVVETFADESFGDFITIENKGKRDDARNCIIGIALAYGIGRDFVSITDDGEREVIRIYLSQPKP